MEGKISQTNTFELYSAIARANPTGVLTRANITDEIANNLKCWCCGNLIRDCIILKEDGVTTVAKVKNSNMFANVSDEFIQTDSKGRHLFIPLCGVNGYEEL